MTVTGDGRRRAARAGGRARLRQLAARRCACSTGVLAGRPFLSVLDGDESLRRVRWRRVVEPLRAMGAPIDGRDDGTLRAARRSAAARSPGMRHELAVASAQVKTALVLAGLQATGTTEIVVARSPSRDHTERMLAALGVPVDGRRRHRARRSRRARARSSSRCRAIRRRPRSSSSPRASRPAPRSCSKRVALNPTRIGVRRRAAAHGRRHRASSRHEERCRRAGRRHLRCGAAPLHGTTIAGDEMPSVQDEIPVLAVAAAFADGVTDIRDAAELAVKESNRIGTRAAGARPARHRGGVAARRAGDPRRAPAGRRRSRATAITASRWRPRSPANAIEADSTVRGWSAVASSYPEFLADLARLCEGDGDDG